MKIKLLLISVLLSISFYTNAQIFYQFDLNPNGDSKPFNFLVCNNLLFFAACDTNFRPPKLWVSDGTVGGTHKIGSAALPAIGYEFPMAALNNECFFTATTGDAGTELWKSDGTAAGTVIVKDINPGSGSGLVNTYLTACNGNVYFFAYDGTNNGLWKSDGTEAGTQLVKIVGAYPYLTAYNNEIYFSGSNDTQVGSELWKSDGTTGGTAMLKEINPGSGSSCPNYFTVYNGKLYFSAMDNINKYQLWVTDGTVSGTEMVANITQSNPGSYGAEPSALAVCNNLLYFQANDHVNGIQPWCSDGTAGGTHILKSINSPGGCNPYDFIACNNKVYFICDDNVHGEEVWVSDGTSGGTQLLSDIASGPYTSSHPAYLTVYNNKVYFRANDESTGDELWVTDGTNTGTHILQPSYINIGSDLTYGSSFMVYDNRLYFCSDYGPVGIELYAFSDMPSSVFDLKDYADNIKLYPNPANDLINLETIQCATSDSYFIEITTIQGQLIKSMELKDINTSIDISGLQSGVYIVKVETEKEITVKKFVKE